MDEHVQKWQYLQGFWRQSLRNSNIYNDFLTFFDEDVQQWQFSQGFWRQSLRNSNIYNEFLTCLDDNVQKWQYLQGFWRQSLWNSNIYNDVLTFLDENMQKIQYLQGFWRQSLRNSNIYNRQDLTFWNFWIWWLLRDAMPETEWDHKVNSTYCIPEENYRGHIAFSKPDISGLWVWTPN